MRRRTTIVAACIAFALLAAAGGIPADAKSGRRGGLILKFPSEIDETGFRLALQSSNQPTTIIVGKGRHLLSSSVFVFGRSAVTICGATGRARDCILESEGAGPVFRIEQSEDIQFRDLTIRTEVPGGQAVRMNAVLDNNFSSFARSVYVRGCTLDADAPVFGTAGAEQLTIDRCKINVRLEDSFGVLWSDGAGLQISRTRFSTEGSTEAFAAVFVAGAGAFFASGERVPDVILTRNKVRGRFLRGFDLADVVGARVHRNSMKLSGESIRPVVGSREETGRVGILVRNADATTLVEDTEVSRNRIRNAHYGVWLLAVGGGAVVRNDLRGCGSSRKDAFFNEYGGALRLTINSGLCKLDILRNDFRTLGSPTSDGGADVPAIGVVPDTLAASCFDDTAEADNATTNKLSGGRALYLGAAKR